MGEYQSDVKVENGFLVYVKELTGKTLTIMIGAENTVGDLKLIIYHHDKITVDQQRLIFEGKQLEDGRTVSSYNIVTSSTVHMILRLGGC